MKNQNSIVFLKDWKILIQSLSAENQLVFWSIYMEYEYGKEIECANIYVMPIWNFIKTQLDRMSEKYNENIVSRNKLNGSKGGRPKIQQVNENPKNPVGYLETQKTLNININKNKNKNIKDKYKEYKEEIENLKNFCKDYFDEKYISDSMLFVLIDLVRIDKYSIEQIKEAIKNAKNDNFWGSQFLSPAKLRAKNKEKVYYIDVFLALKEKNSAKKESINYATGSSYEQ